MNLHDAGIGIPLSTIRISIADMIALRVRTKGDRNSSPPEYLYQDIPMNALSLMATLPRGAFAVSIPHQSESNPGYKIQKLPPLHPEGFVLVYALQPNRRYEAVEIFCEGRSFAVAEFCQFAKRLLENQTGILKTMADRFAYLAPSRNSWGVIQRDNGYTALDPSKIESDLTPELQQRRQGQQSSGVVVRIPIQTGDKQPAGAPLPTFASVELTLDPKPRLQSLWISYEEYQRARILESRPPTSIIPAFHEWLEQFTAESGFESWIFHPGTLFGDHIEWWGDRNRRRTEHEGLDFVEGRQSNGQISSIAEGTPIRAMAEGKVVSILHDFLGQTFVIRHATVTNEGGDVFYTLCSHIQLKAELLGKSIAKGQLLGQLGKPNNVGVPLHFHLAAAWIPQSIRADELTLDHIHSGFAPVVLINFNSLIM